MTRFYVGQRVRIVGIEYFGCLTSPRGLEAIVTGIGSFFGELSGINYTHEVSTGSRKILVNSYEIEPATDSYDLSTWDKCVWQPEHLRANA